MIKNGECGSVCESDSDRSLSMICARDEDKRRCFSETVEKAKLDRGLCSRIKMNMTGGRGVRNAEKSS